jgi:uncharacterized protein YcfJ
MSTKTVITGLVATGMLVSGQAALADPPSWAHGWHDARYDYGRDRDDGRDGPQYDYARVVDVDPIYTQVRVSVPSQECWNETRYEDVTYGGGIDREPRPTAGSMILGGIIGAALGNQIGHGDGRRAATVAGALIGSAIGHDAAERARAQEGGYTQTEYRESRPYTVQRCNTRYEDSVENRIEGYRVRYVYQGREYTTRMPRDPGERVRLRVDVTPEVCE